MIDTRYRITDEAGTSGTVVVHPDELVDVLRDWYPDAPADVDDALYDLADALLNGKPDDGPATFLGVRVEIAD